MTEAQTIDWITNIANEKVKVNPLTPEQKKIFDSRLKTMAEIKQKLKRIDYFGGVETLIAKASILAKSESLFAEESSEIANS